MTAIAGAEDQGEVITRALGAVVLPAVGLPFVALLLVGNDLLSCLPALGILAVALVWTWIAARKALKQVGQLVDSARGDSFGVVQSLLQTETVQCPSCGGFVALLALSVADGVPCPWCSVELVAPGHEADAEHSRAVEALQGLEDQARAAFAERRNSSSTGVDDRFTGRSGFDGRTGVFSGVHEGQDMWYGYDLVDGDFVGRTELMSPGLSERRWLLVAPDDEESMKALARAWQVALPSVQVMDGVEPARVAAGKRTLDVYSDGAQDESASELHDLGRISGALEQLDDGDAVVIDRAGVSIWTLQAGRAGVVLDAGAQIASSLAPR